MSDEGYLLAVTGIGTDGQRKTNIEYTSRSIDNFGLKHLAIRGLGLRTKFHFYGATDGEAFYKTPMHPLGRCRVVIPDDSFKPKEDVHTADALVHSDGTVFVQEGLLSGERQTTLNTIEQVIPPIYREFVQAYSGEAANPI